MGLPPTEGELPTLQKRTSAFQVIKMAFDTALLVIEHLGGNVPGCEPPQGLLTKTQKQARKRGELRDCFDELKNIVSPQGTKLGDLKVLTLGMSPLFSYEVQGLTLWCVGSTGFHDFAGR